MASDLDSGAVLDLLDTERLIQKIATYISRPPRTAAGEKRLGVNLVAVFVFFFFLFCIWKAYRCYCYLFTYYYYYYYYS